MIAPCVDQAEGAHRSISSVFSPKGGRNRFWSNPSWCLSISQPACSRLLS